MKTYTWLWAVAFSIVSFQNCSPVAFKAEEASLSSAESPIESTTVRNCIFNGVEISDGSTVDAYNNSTVPFGSKCDKETRTCTNGLFSGSYNYASCSVGGAAACIFNNRTIPHGESATAFQNSSVPSGSSCVSQSRVCNNGSLSGSYNYSACNVGQPAACQFNGQTIAHGQTINAFLNSSVPFGSSCLSQSRKCDNGVLSGSYTFASCSVGQAAACQFNGQTIANGQYVVAFQSSSPAPGQSCIRENRLCTNGVLSGTYSYATCNEQQANSCLFNGQTVAHGQSVPSFANSNVPYGSSCTSESRTCNNGVLSGSFVFGSCSVGQESSCLFNGKTVPHGQSVNAFSSASVPNGSTCSSQQRTCSNGTLSGSYQFSSCTTNAITHCPAGQTIPGHPSAFPPKSPDGTVTCDFTWIAVPVGTQIYSNQYTSTNGGTIIGNCNPDGSYNYIYSCPNPAGTTCPGGNVTISSPDGSNTCTFNWEMTGASDAGTNIPIRSGFPTGSPAGEFSGKCYPLPRGPEFSYRCPNKAKPSCAAGGAAVPSGTAKSITGSPFSFDGANPGKSCSFYWPQTNANGSISISDPAIPGSYLRGTCNSDGSAYQYEFRCP